MKTVIQANVNRRHARSYQTTDPVDAAIDIVKAVRYGMLVGAIAAIVQAVMTR